jgi:hypothetical protein
MSFCIQGAILVNSMLNREEKRSRRKKREGRELIKKKLKETRKEPTVFFVIFQLVSYINIHIHSFSLFYPNI